MLPIFRHVYQQQKYCSSENSWEFFSGFDSLFFKSHPEYIEENQTETQASRRQASALITRFLLFLMSVLFIRGE